MDWCTKLVLVVKKLYTQLRKSCKNLSNYAYELVIQLSRVQNTVL